MINKYGFVLCFKGCEKTEAFKYFLFIDFEATLRRYLWKNCCCPATDFIKYLSINLKLVMKYSKNLNGMKRTFVWINFISVVLESVGSRIPKDIVTDD